MNEFFQAVRDYDFMQRAVLTGLLASVSCGIVGSYVVARRITYIAGGIAHCVLGGIGAAYYLNHVHGVAWIAPLGGAIVSALLAAVVIGLVSLKGREREDTVIGALWAIGMATGVLLFYRSPGYTQDMMSYLLGNILMVRNSDLALILGLDVVVVTLGILFYNRFLAVCFDEEFARVRGVRVEFYYLLLLALTALTTVLLVTVVGIVLVIALLTLPAAVAGHFSRRLWQMMLLSILASSIFTTGGLALSYGPDLPSGATIVLLAGAVYLIVVVGAAIRRWARRRAEVPR
ncbi:metal ABC transporter permease [Candidatus Sumerlaeota bacterium]|nr:metal ABC transporter permease [Candidatus Sumerlaeota bacterium]